MAYTSKKLRLQDCLKVTSVALDLIHTAAKKVQKQNVGKLDQRAEEEIGDLLSALPAKERRARKEAVTKRITDRINDQKKDIAILWDVKLVDGRTMKQLDFGELRALHNAKSDRIIAIEVSCGAYIEGHSRISLSIDEETYTHAATVWGSIDGPDDVVSLVYADIERAYLEMKTGYGLFVSGDFLMPVIGTVLATAVAYWVINFIDRLQTAQDIVYATLMGGVLLSIPTVVALNKILRKLFPSFECEIGQGVQRIADNKNRRSQVGYSVVGASLIGAVFWYFSR